MTSAVEKKESERVAWLRVKIGQLTNRHVVSHDLPYLEQRYADLRKRKDSGAAMPNAARVDRCSVVSVSLTKRRTELLARICKERQVGLSIVVREAFDAWARSNGYRVEIEHINRTEKNGG